MSNSKNPFIQLSVPSLKGNEWKYVKECIETEWVSSVGSYVERFERDVAGYLGVSCAIACVNGTAALHISMILSGVGAGDEVIVPTLTFIAPVNVVRYVGAFPVFMDCDDSLNLDPQKLKDFLEKECEETKEGLKNKTSGRLIRAIVVVHVFGHPAEMQSISEIAGKYDLKVVEDATESLGSFYKNFNGAQKYTGTVSDFGCLSFNGNKLITTGGGGMILIQDSRLAERAKYLTTQAKDDGENYIHHEIGYNYRLNNVQAAIGCAQMEKIDQFIQRKRENLKKYQEGIAGLTSLRFISEPPGTSSNNWLYTLVTHDDVDLLRKKLKENGIEARKIWKLNHRQKPYKACQTYKIEKAEWYHARCLNLPSSVSLKDEEIGRVISVLREFYGTN